MQDKTIKQHILSVVQTYPWGANASLSDDGATITGLVHSFRSDTEAYDVAFSLPCSIDAVLDYRDSLGRAH